MSTDGGATVTARPLPVAVPVRDLEVQPANSDWWYAATEVGLLVTENGGATWSSSATPTKVAIDELFVGGGRLHLVTDGRGMFSQGDFSGVRNLGGGCQHPNVAGGPTLACTPLVMGGATTFSITGGPAAGYAVLMVTVMPNIPFAWTPSCTIHVFGPFGAINLAGIPIGGGTGSLTMPVGNHPPAAGLGLVFQAAIVDFAFTLFVTNGMLAVVAG